MKHLRASLALLVLTGAALSGQDAVPSTPPPAAEPRALRTPEELEQLLAPIALYPDALIALMLPASTVPADIVLAARHLRESPEDRSQIEHRAWEESVKSLTNYPDVLKWMDDNLQWTKQVGEAFIAQPADVMEAVQRLRAKARAAGTLVDTPQQQVIAEPEVIRIVPAQPNVIYVPYYEPSVVFVDRPVYYHPRPFLTFGAGVVVGSWLAYDCDWRRRTIWHGDRHRRWGGHDWRHPVVPLSPGFTHAHSRGVRQWRPPVQPARPPFSVAYQPRPAIVQPTPFGTSTHRYSGSRSRHDAPQPATNAVRSVPTMPRSFEVNAHRDFVGPRAPSSSARATVNPTPAPAEPAPTYSRPIDNHTSRSRTYSRRGDTRTVEAAPAAQPSLPVVPSLPMANTVRSAPVTGPVAHRPFSRSSAPAHVATAPASVTPHAGSRGHSRAMAAPAVIPALPMARSSAPVAAPAPASPGPQAVAPAAPPTRGGGDGHGRRGGRPEYNRHEH